MTCLLAPPMQMKLMPCAAAPLSCFSKPDAARHATLSINAGAAWKALASPRSSMRWPAAAAAPPLPPPPPPPPPPQQRQHHHHFLTCLMEFTLPLALPTPGTRTDSTPRMGSSPRQTSPAPLFAALFPLSAATLLLGMAPRPSTCAVAGGSSRSRGLRLSEGGSTSARRKQRATPSAT